MEKKFYILIEVGEYTPDQFIGKQWVKGIRQEYLADDNNEYIEDENELQEMIQWMRSKVIGRNHDQVLTCKNVLEAWDEFNKEDHE